MKIIVVGLGEAGRALVRILDNGNHDIVVIDEKREAVETVTDMFRVNGVVGSGASSQTLKKAGAETADVLVALTHTDEINLLSCMQAKSAGTKLCAARLLMPDLVGEEAELKKQYKIDYFVKPRMDLAEEVYRNIGLPGYVKLESYMDERIYVLDLNAVGSSPLIGRSVAAIRTEVNADMRIGIVIRGKRAMQPKDDLVIKENDTLYIVVRKEELDKAFRALGIKRDRVRDVVIVGGRISGGYLTQKLLAAGKKVTMIVDDVNRARIEMERFPAANVIYAEGDITDVLEEERVEKADAIVSLTDNDETNLVTSMYAWSKKIPSVITRVDKQIHVRLLHKVNIDITVSPTEISVFRIIRFISEAMHENMDEETMITEFLRITKLMRN
ncbi:MAG: NAD-binding protein [Lachnospiraceae bacterium]|nr:NAD-binding protein [Lachnospiraceae bacterium]